MLYLMITNPVTNVLSKSIQIERPVTIGRGSIADIQLGDDDTVSRLHALVVPRLDASLELRDLSSMTGTFVLEEDKKIRLFSERGMGGAEKGRATLSVGDKFCVGKYFLEVCSEDLLGEPSWRRKFHEGIKEDEEEITDVEYIVD